MADLSAQQEMFQNRLRKNLRHLRRWARREGISCFRVYDRDIPEIPLTLDLYRDLDGALRLYLSEFLKEERPEAWLESMGAAAQELTEAQSVHLRRRERQRGAGQYKRRGDVQTRFTVEEGGLRFLVNLQDYLDTGLFLDHRLLRRRIRGEVQGKRFLNLFAYTGAFTVYAAAGGAEMTTTVDLSNRYLDWAEENLEENKLQGPQHHFVRADAWEFLREAWTEGERWDIILLDPPTFSNSKAMRGTLDLRRDHRALINTALTVARPGGTVYFSTNARRFRLDPSLREEAELLSTCPPDFQRRPPHTSWRFRR